MMTRPARRNKKPRATYARRLQRLLDASKLTQREFAAAFGVSQTTISNVLNGRTPRPEALFAYRLASMEREYGIAR